MSEFSEFYSMGKSRFRVNMCPVLVIKVLRVMNKLYAFPVRYAITVGRCFSVLRIEKRLLGLRETLSSWYRNVQRPDVQEILAADHQRNDRRANTET